MVRLLVANDLTLPIGREVGYALCALTTIQKPSACGAILSPVLVEPVVQSLMLSVNRPSVATLVERIAPLRPERMADSGCRARPDVNFCPGPGESIAAARAVSRSCLLLRECLEWALDLPKQQGDWGSTGAAERRDAHARGLDIDHVLDPIDRPPEARRRRRRRRIPPPQAPAPEPPP
jgi:hypothetical protein